LKLWDTQTHWCTFTTRSPTDKSALTKLATTEGRKGLYILAGSANGFIHKFDLKSEKVLASWTAHKNGVMALKCVPGQRSLLFSSGQFSDVIKVWDIRLNLMGEAKPIARMVCLLSFVFFFFFFLISALSSAHTNEVWDLLLANDHLYSACQDGSIKEFSMRFQNTRTFKEAHGGHTVYGLAKLSEGVIISCGDDHYINKWDLKSGEKQKLHWKSEHELHSLMVFP